MSRRAQLAAAGLAAAALVALGVALLDGGDDGASVAPPLVQGGAVPEDFVGIVSEDAFAEDSADRDAALERQARVGVGIVRQTFDWARIETTPGRYELSHYDEYIADLARQRLRLLPLLFGTPPFRSSAPSRSPERGTYPPESFDAFAGFAADLARRYGPDGSFWAERPELPKLPVRSWQIWNEPSLPVFWASGPDAAEYARLLTAAGRAIRRVDPEAEIVTAGLPESRIGVPFADFAAGLYEAGAGDAFDTLAIHPYARDAAGVIEAVGAARRLMDRNGDTDKRIWVTEVGWATAGPQSPFSVGEQGQAERIAEVLPALARMQAEVGVRGVVYFNWKDAPPFAGGRDFWGLHTGLLELDGRPKQGLEAFRAVVRQLSG